MRRLAGLAVVGLLSPFLACGLSSGEPAGTVLARDAATGEPLWSRDMAASPDRLVADGGAVAVITFDLDDFYECQFRHGEVVVRDGAGGEKRWSASLGITTERITEHAYDEECAGRPVTMEDGVTVVVSGGKAHAYDGATGDQRWAAPVDARANAPSPVADRQTLALSALGRVVGIDLAGGTPRWELSLEEGHLATRLAARAGVVYVLTEKVRKSADEPSGAALVAVDLVSGHERWRAVPPGDLATARALALVAAPTTVMAAFGTSAHGVTVVAFEDATGAERWRIDVPAEVPTPDGFALAAGGEVVVLASHGQLQGLRLSSGELMWSREMDVYDLSVPSIAMDGQSVAVGVHSCATGTDSCKSVLMGADAGSGEERWQAQLPHELRQLTLDQGIVYATLALKGPPSLD